MIYDGNNLSSILQPEGIIRKSGNSYVYTYALQDQRWYEMQANTFASRYFKKHYNINWFSLWKSENYPTK